MVRWLLEAHSALRPLGGGKPGFRPPRSTGENPGRTHLVCDKGTPRRWCKLQGFRMPEFEAPAAVDDASPTGPRQRPKAGLCTETRGLAKSSKRKGQTQSTDGMAYGFKATEKKKRADLAKQAPVISTPPQRPCAACPPSTADATRCALPGRPLPPDRRACSRCCLRPAGGTPTPL